MIYLSKGILPWRPSETTVSVSYCGALHKLNGVQAALWLNGQHKPGYTENPEQDAALQLLSELGIAECGDGADDATIFRLLTNCSICPVRVKTNISFLNPLERRLWRWITRAGLRLTMAELVYLVERDVLPAPELLGEANRQSLTEAIYTTETIYDGILEGRMERSPARDKAVLAILGLLRKQKIFLI